MRKIPFVFIGLLFSLVVYADNSKIEVRGSVNDGTTTKQDSGLITKYFTTGVRQQQSVTCTASSFTGITVPTGDGTKVKGIMIDMGTARGLQLKGVTADIGISLDSTFPTLIPFSGDNNTIGITNNTAVSQSVTVYFF